MGEFRVHYAGFFDPGFGIRGGRPGGRAVLEVRRHEVPFVLEDGQIVGRLATSAWPTAEAPLRRGTARTTRAGPEAVEALPVG